VRDINAFLVAMSDGVDAWLVQKILNKGVAALNAEEIGVCSNSATFRDEWFRVTGDEIPEKIWTSISERACRAHQRLQAGPNDIQIFLKCVSSGDVEQVRQQLRRSPDYRTLLTSVDSTRKTALHLATQFGHEMLIQVLCDHKAEIDQRDRTGRTPLHLACEFGHHKLLSSLLNYDANTDASDGLGRNPFHLACCSDNPQVSQVLISRRPNVVNGVDKHGRTGLFYAVLNNHAMAQEMITKQVLDSHSDVNFRDAYGKSALHYAAEEGRRSIILCLLRYRGDPRLQDNVHCQTPLQVASNEGCRKEIRKFLGLPASDNIDRPRGGNEVTGGIPLPNEAIAPAIARSPVALGVTFAQMRDRFIRLLTRVQEGGIQQLEHLQQPHLFNGAWMADVSTHQELFKTVLSNVSGPETCIRVFNLMRPPSHFPASKGDEKDIAGYFQKGAETNALSAWDADNDPFNFKKDLEEEFSGARKQDLMREVHLSRQEIETREASIEDLKRRIVEAKGQLEKYTTPEEAKAMKEELTRLRSENISLSLEGQELHRQLSENEGQTRILQIEVQEKAALLAKLRSEVASLTCKLEFESEKKGEESAWREMKEALEVELEASERKKGELQARISDLERKLVTQKEGMVKSSELNTALDQVKSVQKEMVKKETEVAKGVMENRRLNEEITKQKQEMEALKQKSADSEKDLGREKEECERAKKELLMTKYPKIMDIMGLKKAGGAGGGPQASAADQNEVQRLQKSLTESREEIQRLEAAAEKEKQNSSAGNKSMSHGGRETKQVGRSSSAGGHGTILKGDLTIKIISATNLRCADLTSKSDPYCIVTVDTAKGPSATTSRTKTIDNNCDPVWNETHDFHINFDPKPEPPADSPGATGLRPIQFEILDEDTFSKSDFLGYAEYAFPQKSETKQMVTLQLHNKKDSGTNAPKATGWITFTVTWVMSGQNPPHNLENVIELPPFKDPDIVCDPFAGSLWFRIISATSLRAADFPYGTSDPYIKVTCPTDQQKTTTYRTKQMIKKTLDAVFNEVLDEFKINLPYTPGPDKKILIEAMDYDLGSPDDPIGSCQVPLPTTFGERKLMCCRLEDKQQKAGEYMSTILFEYWLLRPGVDAEIPDAPTTLERIPPDIKLPRVGQIQVTCLSGSGLRNADQGGLFSLMSADASDPYCIVSIAGAKPPQQKTSTKDNTLDPQWNESLIYDIPKFLSTEETTKIKQEWGVKVRCMDEDIVGNPDDLLGVLELPEVYKDMYNEFDKPMPNFKRYRVKRPLVEEGKSKVGVTGHLDLDIAFNPLYLPAYLKVEETKEDKQKFVLDRETVSKVSPTEDERWYQKDLSQATKMSGKINIEVFGAAGLKSKSGVISKAACAISVPCGMTQKKSKQHISVDSKSTDPVANAHPIWKKLGNEQKWQFVFNVNWTVAGWPKEGPDVETAKWVKVSVYDHAPKNQLGQARIPMPGEMPAFPLEGFDTRLMIDLGENQGAVAMKYEWIPEIEATTSIQRTNYHVTADGMGGPLDRKCLVGNLRVKINSANDLENAEAGGLMGMGKAIFGKNITDPIAKVRVPRTMLHSKAKPDQESLWKLDCIPNTLEPVWNVERNFQIFWADMPSQNLQLPNSEERLVTCAVYHMGTVKGETFLGEVNFPLPMSDETEAKSLEGVEERKLKMNKEIRKDQKRVQGSMDLEYQFTPFFFV